MPNSEKKRSGPLPGAWARRIKAWAEGVFSKPNGVVRAGNSRGNKAVPPPPRPGSPEEAVSAFRTVPPSPQREQVPAAREMRWPAMPEARLEGTPAKPPRRAAPPGVLSFEPISYARQPMQAPRPAPPLAESPVERSLPRFGSLAVPVAAPPRRPTPAQDPRPTVLHMPAASNSAEPPSRAEPLYPWKEEPPSVPRRPSQQIPLEDLDTLINRSWPPLANEAEPNRASVLPVTLEEHRGEPWPELPEPPPADSTEAEAALRQWERLSRLDRELQGE
jgi:hypothetical protein